MSSEPGSAVRVPILMYHEVTPRPAPGFRKYCVSPAAFAAQMRWLALAGHVPITLDDLLRARHGQQSLPRRPVIITFDDGYQDSANFAAPVLLAHGFTATFFLVAGMVGSSARWLLAERGLELALMGWADARRLEAAGLVCGAHSMSHPRLAELGAAACQAELRDARLRLEDQLGHAIVHLAYPHGSYSDSVRQIAADCGYQTACSVRIGHSDSADDLLALHRVPINGHESFLDFVSRLYTSQPWRAALGGAARTVAQPRGRPGRAQTGP